MHELSIATSIVEIACEEAARHNGARVETVHLELGALSGVVKDALLFAWDMACAETPIAGSRLAIEEVAVVIRCPDCGKQHTLTGEVDLRCPDCGGMGAEVLHGRELQVTALEIEDR
jgi:hydrogenase nickel incorporation protein HypA/HybF